MKAGQPKATTSQLIDEMLTLYNELILPYLKIRRDMPFPTEPERSETDGEHSYTLAMLSITLAERMNLNLDAGLIARYALTHDLVEVHAGDVSVRAETEYNQKAKREHEAFLLIQKRFLNHAPWIAKDIEKYEKRSDEESKFVYACDKLMGALVRIAGDGAGWAAHYPEKDGSGYHRVVKILRSKAQTYPPLLELFDALHLKLDKLGPLYLEKSKHHKI